MDGVSFHRLAERELNDEAMYYEHESPGLGLSFLDEIERYIKDIMKRPSGGRRFAVRFDGDLSAIPIRDSLFGSCRRNTDTRNHELETATTYWVGRS